MVIVFVCVCEYEGEGYCVSEIVYLLVCVVNLFIVWDVGCLLVVGEIWL